MPPSTDASNPQQAKLPTHAAYTSLQNRISLIHSSRSSLLKSLTSSSAASARAKQEGSTHSGNAASNPHDREREEDEDFAKGGGARANEGVGYVADRTQASSARDAKKVDAALRRKFLGKRAWDEGRAKSSRREESSEDEEGGRSALGRAKKKRKEQRLVDGTDEAAQDAGLDHTEKEDSVDDSAPAETALTVDTRMDSGPSATKKHKKKKRKSHSGSTI